MDNQMRQQMQAAIDHDTPIAHDVVATWTRDDTDESLADVAWFFAEHSRLLEDEGIRHSARFLIRQLAQIADSNSGTMTSPSSMTCLSQYDALNYLIAVFRILWCRRCCPDLLDEVRDVFSTLVMQWPDPNSDMVVITVLEHLFADPEKRQFFSSWLTHPVLGRVYREAETLACSLQSQCRGSEPSA